MTVATEPRVIAATGDLCGENPLWNASNNTLYWTDAVGKRLHKYLWRDRRTELVKEGLAINGFAFASSGGFVITNGDGIWLWDGLERLSIVAKEVEGNKCQVNDCIADPAGRLFTGSVYYTAEGDYQLGHLIRIDNDGVASIVDEGFHMANGLGFSPDQTTLYFTDSGSRIIYAYDYEVRGGRIWNRRIFVKVPATQGLPDGLTVDAEGFVWSAQWYGSCVVRYDPDGDVERVIEVPAKQPSSVAFGGTDLTDIFITSASLSEPMPIMPPGYDTETGNIGGQLYHLNLSIPGNVEFQATIKPKQDLFT